MGSLGTTSDPKALIPGEPAELSAAAETLRGQASTMSSVGGALGAVRAPHWDGVGSAAFWQNLASEKTKWAVGHDHLTAAAQALDDHSSSVDWAQKQAAEAIAKWKEGEELTRSAFREFHAEHDPLAKFDDSGKAVRAEAQAILDRAKEQLQSAGDAHAARISDSAGKAKDSPVWLTLAAAAAGGASRVNLDGSFDIKDWGGIREQAKKGKDLTFFDKFNHDFYTAQKEKAKERKKGAPVELGLNIDLWKLENPGSEDGSFEQYTHKIGDDNASLKLLGTDHGASLAITEDGLKGSANAEAYLAKAEANGETDLGPAQLKGEASASVGAEAAADLTVGPEGVKANAGASVGAKVDAEGSISAGAAELSGTVEASAGAEADASFSAGKDGLNANVGAFAGARAEFGAAGDVGGIGAGVNGEVWAGAGVEADLAFGKDEDGKWRIGGEIGAGLGVGGKVGVDITIDPGKVMDTAADVADATQDAVNAIKANDPGALASALNPFD